MRVLGWGEVAVSVQIGAVYDQNMFL